MGQYKVIFYGLAVAGPEEEARLLKGLQKKFNLTPEKAERLLQKVPVVVKKGTSPEEMEKYVKAFQEIGGKVRIEEEEPVTEFREPPETPEPETKEFAGRTMTCPQCAFEQPETNTCVKCGLEFSKYEPYKEVASSQGQAIPSEVKEVPTEREPGFFGSFFRTTKDVLFSPVRFFRRSAAGEGYAFPLIYGLITGIIGMGGTMVWQYMFFSEVLHIGIPNDLPYGLHIMTITIAMPIIVLFLLFVWTVITHICLIIVGGNKMGFQQTFRAKAFSYGAKLFGVIPIIGDIIGFVYTIVLFIIGIKEGHGTSTARAVLAVFFPFIMSAILLIISLIFIRIFLGSLGILGGIGI